MKKLHKVAIEKYQKILRSGKDYTVTYMCEEVAEKVNLEGGSVRKIINKHYKQIVSPEMIEFIDNITCTREEEIKQFSEKFNVCKRESILLIRYLRRGKRNE